MADIKLLETLCTARGISGFEEEVRSIILKEIKGLADSVEMTPLGNIIAFKRGKERPKIKLMLNAHMDEVGMIITHISEDGLLHFSTVGGIDKGVLCGRNVLVSENTPGVIGAKPIHLLEGDEKDKPVPMKDLYIDIGAKNRADAERYVKPGDPVTFESNFDTSHGKIRGRALDDRAGCAILIGMMREELPYDMTFAFVVQEENGLIGGRTAAYTIAPQAALVVESTTAADVADVAEERQVCHVGEGPVVSFMDMSTIYDRKLYDASFACAKEAGIPIQCKRAVAGGNDSGAIHQSRGGVRTLAVSLPCRYLHSATGLISEVDYHNTQKLMLVLAGKICGGAV